MRSTKSWYRIVWKMRCLIQRFFCSAIFKMFSIKRSIRLRILNNSLTERFAMCLYKSLSLI